MSLRGLVLVLGGVVVAGVVATLIVSGSRNHHVPVAQRTTAVSLGLPSAPTQAGAAAAAPSPAAASPAAPAAAAGSSPAATAAKLSTRQLLGQRIIYAYAGRTVPASLLAIVREGEAGGVIFFGSNVADPTAFKAAIRELQAANADSPVRVPLLLMTDQEGGEVRRLSGAPLLSEKQIGESRDAAALAARAGVGAAQNLAGAGLNVNLAPVLDVYRSPRNFIDSTQRSYSSNAGRVATLGASFIRAQQRAGVAGTAKHFPGLGAATAAQDTDAVPVTLDVSAAILRSTDELPYRAAIAAGVKLVMTSWAIYPALDPRLPAGLSPAVVGGELRGRLGFGGVVISDELAAPALGAFGAIGHRAALAASAGVDLLVCSEPNPDDNTPQVGTLALQGLSAALSAGQISRASVGQAASLIIRLRSSVG